MFITHSLRKGLQRSSTLQRKAELKAAADQGAPCSPVPLQVNTCGCGPLSAPALTGPFLRFRNFIQSTNLWTGSVLIVVQRPTSNFSLHFRQISSSGPESESESVTSVPSLFLSEFQGWKFLRFDLEFPLLSTASEVEYWIVEEEASYGSDLTKSDITSAAPESEPMSTAVPAVILFSESAAANVPSAPATVLAEPDVITGIKTQKQMAARAAPEPAGTGPFEHESELPSMDDRGTASFFFQRYRFAVAAEGAPWHWAFYSCNGFSAETSPEEVADWGGLAPLWKDLEGVHRARPLHVMVRPRDRLYAYNIRTFFCFCIASLELDSDSPCMTMFELSHLFHLYVRRSRSPASHSAAAATSCTATTSGSSPALAPGRRSPTATSASPRPSPSRPYATRARTTFTTTPRISRPRGCAARWPPSPPS